MKEKNMTALVSCFARCYHYKNNCYRIFNDTIADKIISDEEYKIISYNMKNGIKFFNPDFESNDEEALKWIVDKQISPSVLGRSAFCEKSLSNAIKIGCRQYLIFASGYDTYAYRNTNTNLKVFEIDKKDMIDDKIKRVNNSNLDSSKVNFIKCDFTSNNWTNNIINSKYNRDEISFSSLLGISYYLSKEEFIKMIKNISNIICIGSSIVFDYQTYEESRETSINEKLASAANEMMKSKYSYEDIEKILSDSGFLIYEHLNNKEMANNYFEKYNILNPDNKIEAPRGICYVLAVKMEEVL